MPILMSLKNAMVIQNLSKPLFFQNCNKKPWLTNINRHLSTQLPLEDSQEINLKVLSFQDVIKERREQANRTILVQVQAAQSYKELYSYCNTIGSVKNMLHYSAGVEPMHFILVEFTKESDVHNVLQSSSYLDDNQIVPVQSPFLWFKAPSKRQSKLKTSKNFKLLVENGCNLPKDSDIQQILREASDVSDQMVKLFNITKLNDLGTRLRFLVAKQIEVAVSGMFPTAVAYPFGSSVNGFGKMGCDLDLVLRLNDETKQINDDTRLVYHCKAAMGSERSTCQRHMEAIGDVVQLFLPGCSQVRRILQARVPIIKFYQQLTDIECDLSMTNMSGVHMSDFLWIMSSIDERVRPLVFTIRKWAAEIGLTNSSPGRWISNFSLTLLVLAFLQSKSASQPILPSLNTLVKMAGSQDKFVTEDGINCTFLRDINKYLNSNLMENKDSLKSLLKQFFEFYSHFDFASKAVCLNESVSITKPEHSAMYIVNPLERGLNVSKNVSLEEVEKFRSEIRNAAWCLESEDSSPNWGLLSLFQSKKRNSFSITSNNIHANSRSKLIEVSKLFEDEKEEKIEFKNESVKKSIESIKKQHKMEMKKLDDSLGLNRQKSGR